MVFKVPKSAAKAADKLYELRQERYALQKQADVLKASEVLCEAFLKDVLPTMDARGVSGQIARVECKVETVPVAKSWEDVWAHIKRTGSFDLMQRRLNTVAVKERWEDGKQVPGVEAVKVVLLSLHKL